MSKSKQPFRCGMVAIVGRPNVGKSTLLNRLLGTKLSITSPKPQTTRHRVRGIKTTNAAQLVFVDTPGLHQDQKGALSRAMNKAAAGIFDEVDAVLFVVEALQWTEDDQRVLGLIQRAGKPFIVVVNKVDKIADKTALFPYLQSLQERAPGALHYYPLAARTGAQVDNLEPLLVPLLSVGEPMFPEDQFTDHSMRFLAAEIVREKLMRRLSQELPYSLAVEIEKFVEGERAFEIGAVIWVERPGHKAIVIGKEGAVLKEIGTKARIDMERLFGHPVFLHLWVKVKEGWSDDVRLLRSLGLDGE